LAKSFRCNTYKKHGGYLFQAKSFSPSAPVPTFGRFAGLRKYPWLGKTIFAPGTWTLLYRDEKLAGFPVAEVSAVKAVAARPFPLLLICDEKDDALPCRHSQMIYAAARGPKQLWVVPGAFHTAAYGFAPQEFRRRVLTFFAEHSSAN
jgi:fermentation-respiration switch protein FrsA (DUF1100 family)